MSAPATFPMDLTQQVIARVAQRHGLPASAMTGHRKHRFVAVARQEAYFEVHRQRPRLSLSQIGAAFDGRDHTTILHGIRCHAARMAWVDVLTFAATEDDQPDLFRRAA